MRGRNPKHRMRPESPRLTSSKKRSTDAAPAKTHDAGSSAEQVNNLQKQVRKSKPAQLAQTTSLKKLSHEDDTAMGGFTVGDQSNEDEPHKSGLQPSTERLKKTKSLTSISSSRHRESLEPSTGSSSRAQPTACQMEAPKLKPTDVKNHGSLASVASDTARTRPKQSKVDTALDNLQAYPASAPTSKLPTVNNSKDPSQSSVPTQTVINAAAQDQPAPAKPTSSNQAPTMPLTGRDRAYKMEDYGQILVEHTRHGNSSSLGKICSRSGFKQCRTTNNQPLDDSHYRDLVDPTSGNPNKMCLKCRLAAKIGKDAKKARDKASADASKAAAAKADAADAIIMTRAAASVNQASIATTATGQGKEKVPGAAKNKVNGDTKAGDTMEARRSTRAASGARRGPARKNRGHQVTRVEREATTSEGGSNRKRSALDTIEELSDEVSRQPQVNQDGFAQQESSAQQKSASKAPIAADQTPSASSHPMRLRNRQADTTQNGFVQQESSAQQEFSAQQESDPEASIAADLTPLNHQVRSRKRQRTGNEQQAQIQPAAAIRPGGQEVGDCTSVRPTVGGKAVMGYIPPGSGRTPQTYEEVQFAHAQNMVKYCRG